MKPRRALHGAAILACLVSGCAWTTNPALSRIEGCVERFAPRSSDVVVRMDADGRLWAGDDPYFARGVNSYPLLEHVGGGHVDKVNQIFELAVNVGRPLVRTLAFLQGGDHPARTHSDDGALREDGLRALDSLLHTARDHGVRLILVLTNHWGDYGGAPWVLRTVAPDEHLPVEAFYSDPRAIALQKQYAEALVRRVNTIDGTPWARDPAIFAWELANEPRCTDPRYCDEHTLPSWATTMATALRDAGATQLVAWGGTGTDDDGTTLEAVARDGHVDLITLHLYPQLRGSLDFGSTPEATNPLVAVRWGQERIEAAVRAARAHRRALLVEEMGWRTHPGPDADGERATVLAGWLRASREHDAGALPWMIAEAGRNDFDGFLIRPFEELATTGALACE